MDNAFILNNSITDTDLKDAIFEKIYKAQAVTSCLLVNNGQDAELPFKEIYGVVWAISDILDEIECLFTRLDKVTD